MADKRDFDERSQLRDIIKALLALVLPAEKHELVAKLTDIVAECEGVAEHRGKLWGDLTERERNIVANRVGAVAHELLSAGHAAEAGVSLH